MKNSERFAQANSIYQAGLKRVKETPEPVGQKFLIGAFVKIAKDLGSSMIYFKADAYAVVKHTYAHAYWGDDVKSYALFVKQSEKLGDWCSVAWYKEEQLELVTDSKLLKKLKSDFSKSKYVLGNL